MVSMKVDDKNVWDNYVKDNKVFGFSIEGQFANKLTKKNYKGELSDQHLDNIMNEVTNLIKFHYDK